MSKPISPRLAALFATRPVNLFKADVYRITLIDGTELRYCGGDQDLTLNGLVYSAGGVQIGPYFGTDNQPAVLKQSIGTSIDTTLFEVLPGSATVGGVPFLTACKNGVFDGATVRVYRLFMPTWGDTRRGPILTIYGRVAEVDVGRTSAIFTVNSNAEILDQPFPRNLYQPGCVNNLGDAPCGVNLTALAVAAVIIAGSTSSLISANFAAAPAGRFNQGKITFTSGTLLGFSRTIKSAVAGAPGTVTMLRPFPSAPAAADTFNLFPGCDKTYAGADGCAKFANQARWRGEDLIPVAEQAV